MANPRKGDIGVELKITVQEDGSDKDISDFETYEIILEDPSGNTSTKTGSLSGTTDITYTTESGTLNESGLWQIQGRIKDDDTGNKYKTSIGSFPVDSNL